MSEPNPLALYFTPDAIRDHFEGDVIDNNEDGGLATWIVHEATDDQLRELGEACLTSDTLYSEFHRLLSEIGEEIMREAA
jgi:hypothetical protein